MNQWARFSYLHVNVLFMFCLVFSLKLQGEKLHKNGKQDSIQGASMLNECIKPLFVLKGQHFETIAHHFLGIVLSL